MPSTTGIQSVGVYFAFHGICDKLGLTKLLKRYFPEHWEQMLTTAQYMLSGRNVIYYLNLKDYVQEHKTAGADGLDDAQISCMFSQLR